ncbi:MAG: hypothetical protein OES26_12355 [Gammaproteobacteria bacterium]|nr:hypothetical protein [Gammaproteobacteria bacterium]
MSIKRSAESHMDGLSDQAPGYRRVLLAVCSIVLGLNAPLSALLSLTVRWKRQVLPLPTLK